MIDEPGIPISVAWDLQLSGPIEACQGYAKRCAKMDEVEHNTPLLLIEGVMMTSTKNMASKATKSKTAEQRPGTAQFPGQDMNQILGVLNKYKKVAMVGLSANTNRPSYYTATYLRDNGYKITPVNPSYDEVMGLKSYASLADVPGPLEIVDIFRQPEEVPALMNEAIRLGAKVIWLQLGMIHEKAAEKAKAAGLEVVMDRCMKIEHARFHGGT